MLVTVDDHPELSSPVSQMIIGNNLVPEKRQRFGYCITNNGRPNVPDVHRLSNVGRRKVNDIGLGAAVCSPLDDQTRRPIASNWQGIDSIVAN